MNTKVSALKQLADVPDTVTLISAFKLANWRQSRTWAKNY